MNDEEVINEAILATFKEQDKADEELRHLIAEEAICEGRIPRHRKKRNYE